VGRTARVRAAREAGNFRLAADLARTLVEDIERAQGADAIELAVVLNELGMIGKGLGTFDDAESAYVRALDIHERRGATASADVAALLHNLAGLAHAKGDPAAAEPLARRGIAIRRTSAKPDTRALAEDWAALAAILVDLGRLREADVMLHDVLRMYERAYGAVHYEIAVTLHNIGSLQFRQGRWLPAAETLRRALDMKARVLGDDHVDLGVTLHNLACCYLRLGRPDTATVQLRRAITVLESTVDPSHPMLTSCRGRLAEALNHRSRG
jgi:tetratricopeptide (TPR) repeat protein